MLTSSAILCNRFLPLVGRSFLIEYLYGSKHTPHIGTYEAPLTYLKTVLVCASAIPHYVSENTTANTTNTTTMTPSCPLCQGNITHNNGTLKEDRNGDTNSQSINVASKKQEEFRKRRWREKYGEESWLVGHLNRRQRRHLRCMIEAFLPSTTAHDHLLQQQLIYYVNSLTDESTFQSRTTPNNIRNSKNGLKRTDGTDHNPIVNMHNNNNDNNSLHQTDNDNNSVSELHNKNNTEKENNNISDNSSSNNNVRSNNVNDIVEEADKTLPHSIFPNNEYDDDEDEEEDVKMNTEVDKVSSTLNNNRNNAYNNKNNSVTSGSLSESSFSLTDSVNNNTNNNDDGNNVSKNISTCTCNSNSATLSPTFPWNTWLDVVAQYINTSLSHSLEVWTARVLLYDAIWTWLVGTLQNVSVQTNHSNFTKEINTPINTNNETKINLPHNKLSEASEIINIDEECACYLRQIRSNVRISLIASHIGLSSAVRSAIEELTVHELILARHKSKVLRLQETYHPELSCVTANSSTSIANSKENINNNNNNHEKNNTITDDQTDTDTESDANKSVEHTSYVALHDLKKAIKHYRSKEEQYEQQEQ